MGTFLDIAIGNSKKLQNLPQNLLDVSKIEINSLSLHKEEFYLNDLIIDIIKEYGENSLNQGCFDFVFDGSGNYILVYVDKNMICQVITNLIDNSIKFISKGNAISITVEQRKSDKAANNPDKHVVVVCPCKRYW